jgi:hypothetical protein
MADKEKTETDDESEKTTYAIFAHMATECSIVVRSDAYVLKGLDQV